MRSKLENLLWRYPTAEITEGELAILMDGTPNSRYSRLKRAVKNKELIRIRRGLFYLNEHLGSPAPHPFSLAQKIYGPSYISLESALSFHGLIPEAVYTITSVTIKRNKHFSTPLGEFYYLHLPVDNFFMSVNLIKEKKYQFMMASPWKALLDYIFCYKKNWVNLDLVTESLRIELNDLPKMTRTELNNLQAFYRSHRIDQFIAHIPKEFIDEH